LGGRSDRCGEAMTDQIDGIPIVNVADVIKPALARYGRTVLDPAVRADIVSDIRAALSSGDLDAMRRFLSADEAYWLGNLQLAYFQAFEGVAPLEGYAEWAHAKCDLLVAIASQTRDEDPVIQHLLNYEDFHVEVLPFPFGPSFIATLYELRGLDFFLFHYMGGETTAYSDEALFAHAACVGEALSRLGRVAEATEVNQQLDLRRRRLRDIERDFRGPEYDPAPNLVGRLRIASERFWSEYLTPSVWTALERESRDELSDAFSMEYLLRQQVLTSWTAVALALCRVVERELARAIFLPWCRNFQQASWTPPEPASERARKRIQSRKLTYDTIQARASAEGHPPTLGELLFIARFWNDPLMNECTNAFRAIQQQVHMVAPTFSAQVATLVTILEQPLITSNAAMTIPEGRNRAAHPREETDIDWPGFVEQLKVVLGRPPAEILRLAVGLSAASTAAQQQHAADGVARRR